MHGQWSMNRGKGQVTQLARWPWCFSVFVLMVESLAPITDHIDRMGFSDANVTQTVVVTMFKGTIIF